MICFKWVIQPPTVETEDIFDPSRNPGLVPQHLDTMALTLKLYASRTCRRHVLFSHVGDCWCVVFLGGLKQKKLWKFGKCVFLFCKFQF